MLSSLFKKKWDPKGKHCFITGGSAGTGLSLAILLTKKGADVSIVARNKERLDKALSELEAVRQSPSQKLHAYSFAVDNPEGAAASLEAAAATHDGKCPDALFLCAGASRPSFFVEETGEGLRKGMEMTYWSQAFSALAGVKRMVKDGVKGKIVFVSSVLGYFSIVGYSTYSPGKFAIRGLAEALQSECMLYDIDIHAAFPGTIFSPGLEEEQKHKPKVTLKIEETDDGATPEVVAAGILKGVQRGNFHITYDFIGNVFRASTRGSSPGNNVFVDTIYGLIGWIALPIWRKTVDSTVRAHRAEHLESLRQKGLVA
ncbi:oxidoreductase [Panus rudis PR-1116 ss-1]|nr:oxidoreductase [Panus rudis PR-1116 ss-1]